MIDRPDIPAPAGGADNSLFDLESVIASGWADPEVFPPQEYAKAADFYASLRRHDERLLRVREAASVEIAAWTGRAPRDVGSFGLRLNPGDQRPGPRHRLSPTGTGAYCGGAATARSVQRGAADALYHHPAGVEIDLSVLTEEDFTVACRMLDEINATMNNQERVAHTWVKYLLWSSGRLDTYAEWKLVTYRRFCSEFNWVPIPQKAVTAG